LSKGFTGHEYGAIRGSVRDASGRTASVASCGVLRRFALIVACAVAALAGAVPAHAVDRPCGLPADPTLWGDFADGSVGFRNQVFARPGLVLASTGVNVARGLRARGAQTVYWAMRLGRYVGTPTAPADPSTIESAGNALVDAAVASSGCDAPLIVLNELHGGYIQSPWPAANVQYRANVLALLQTIAARGAHAYLLVPGKEGGARAPYVGGEAADWWRQAAQVADIVREVHFNAPSVYRRGVVLASRARRRAMRAAIATFANLGIPVERIGLQVGFQSGSGKGGREGLQPREAWLETVKLEALAARQVSAEQPIGSIWSWGWGTFGPGTEDPDKQAAACVYLWARDQNLCDGPGQGGAAFDASLTEGQILLPPGALCAWTGGSIPLDPIDRLTHVTGDRQVALGVLLNGAVLANEFGPADPADVAHAVQGIVATAFGGDPNAYEAALAAAGLDDATAAILVGNQLVKQAAAARLLAQGATTSVDAFTAKRATTVLNSAVCLRDEVPPLTTVDGLDAVPFLRLPVPSTTIAADVASVVYGGQVQLSGTATSSRATESVTIVAQTPDGARTDVTTVPVDPTTGGWAATVTPSAATIYRALSRSALSPPVTVTVSPQVALGPSGTGLVAVVTPARPAARVLLQRRTSAGWRMAALATLDPSSQAIFRWNPKPGSYVVRAVITKPQAGRGPLGGQSALVKWKQPKPPQASRRSANKK
jgi:hypothetical protein